MKHIPSVGSKVEVITRHKDSYIYSENEYIEYRYIAEVLPSPKWIEHNSFAISSDDPEIDFRVIAACNVVNLKYISGGPDREVDNSTQIFKIKSYTVLKSKSGYRCTCVGYHYHRKCKHIAEVKEKNGV